MTEGEEKTAPTPDALQAFKPFEHFCKCMLDAYAVIDKGGRIVKCNQMLSTLIGLPTKQILRSGGLDELFTFTVAGQRVGTGDFLANMTPGRYDEVNGKAGDKADLNLIIGTYPLTSQAEIIGCFILLRDVTAETSLQGKYNDKASQSVTDSLTGLFNRRHFLEFLKNQLNGITALPPDSPQREISILMFDIDHFKKINDSHGHQAGDDVLQQAAKLMRDTFRRTDVIARYGGEEFLVILPGTDLQRSVIAAEKLRMAFAHHPFTSGEKVIPVTISCGAAQIKVGSESGEQTIARADEALYASKHNGRNRISIHDGQTVAAADVAATLEKKSA